MERTNQGLSGARFGWKGGCPDGERQLTHYEPPPSLANNDYGQRNNDTRRLLIRKPSGDPVNDAHAPFPAFFREEEGMREINPKRRHSVASLMSTLKRHASILAIALTTVAGSAALASANDGRIIHKGDMAVSGFSGTVFPEGGLPPGINPIDETFIDPDGATVRIFRMQNLGEPPRGQLVNLPPPFEVKAGQIGQVFGLAYDDGRRDDSELRVPNLYATAATLHGLEIVIPDSDGDGRPERVKEGQPNADFMAGQWGVELGGGPGAIWKIDGVTGEVSLFANVELDGEPNSGPGLGQIAFDKEHRQFFVSDGDTGMMHRFDMEGTDLGHFDHGVDGRPNHGLDAVPHDAGNRMDITSPAFKTEDPSTWGFAAAERMVNGVQVHGRRVYYATREPLQIWSVGIKRDGSFANDARWELDVASEKDYAVTDIVFDQKGFMYLAQRGDIQNDYDYSHFAEAEHSQVLRYWREHPDDPATPSKWVEVPQEYAVGFPVDHKMALGGIDVGYDRDKDGYFIPGACDGMIAKTGELLRTNEEFEEKLAEGGPFAVHGVQLTDKRLVRPANVPPWKSYFVDYDGDFNDPEVRGHVGDVEIWKDCRGIGFGEYIPGEPTTPEFPGGSPCLEIETPEYFCNAFGELEVDLYVHDTVGLDGDSLKAQSKKPGVDVSPLMQTRPTADDPFTLGILGTHPGERFSVGVCVYNSGDAAKGGTFPCCKATIPLETPDAVCAP